MDIVSNHRLITRYVSSVLNYLGVPLKLLQSGAEVPAGANAGDDRVPRYQKSRCRQLYATLCTCCWIGGIVTQIVEHVDITVGGLRECPTTPLCESSRECFLILCLIPHRQSTGEVAKSCRVRGS